MVDRVDDDCRCMLEVCGFSYDPARDAYSNGLGGRSVRVDTILAHTQLWVAQWITQMLPPGEIQTAMVYRFTSPPRVPRRSPADRS